MTAQSNITPESIVNDLGYLQLLSRSFPTIADASTEIITRTSPTIWDVVIAFVGGLAGIIGARKKEANNIVPGVAIATALMPPVCTVGYSIATGNLEYMVGASYLFSINCSFIMITHILALM